MTHVLLLDDCGEIGALVKSGLKPYMLTQAFTIAQARQLLDQQSFDLILIDVELPDGNGNEFCAELTGEPRYQLTPKIILSSRDQTSDKVFGLYSGADDYVSKPFSNQELKARVDACLRRAQGHKREQLKIHCFQFDPDYQKCSLVEGSELRDLSLTPTEYRILLTLAKSEGRPFSRREIVREIWSTNGLHIETRGVDAHISHLRKKLGPLKDCIRSIYAKGYVFEYRPAEQHQDSAQP